MNTAILCPAGPLDRFGYQTLYPVILENLCAFAWRVYLYSTTRSQPDLAPLLGRFPNLVYISSERTWLNQEISGKEIFQIHRLEQAANDVLEQCRQEGAECALHIHINQYIPAAARPSLAAQCETLLASRKPFAWLNKKYQVGPRLFHADTRLPWIINLSTDHSYEIRADSLQHRDGSTVFRIQHGEFRRWDRAAIVDCPYELTLEEMGEKMDFVRGYEELNPAVRWQGFDQETYLAYLQNKLNSKLISAQPLDPTGKTVAALSRETSLSRTLLSSYRPGLKRRFFGLLKGALSQQV